MRILHYLPSLLTIHGGPVRAVSDIAHALGERGHSVTILTQEAGSCPQDWAGDPLAPKIVQMPGTLNVRVPLRGERKRIGMAAVAHHDVVHVHGLWEVVNVHLARMARAMGKPYIVSLRGMADDWCMGQKALRKRVFHYTIQKNHLARAFAVHCTAQGELEQSCKWFPRELGIVLPNLLDLDPFRHPPGPEQALRTFPDLARVRRPRVLFLSRIHVKKGADVFLRAARLATDRGLDATWVLAGTGDAGYEASIKSLAQSLGLADRTVFTGHVDNELKVSLYQACQVFALPTSQENFGFVFPESLAAGVPVVTTKGVDIWPELESSKASLIIERTPEAFADALAGLLNDPPRLAAMSQQAKSFALRHFEETKIITGYEALYARADALKKGSRAVIPASV